MAKQTKRLVKSKRSNTVKTATETDGAFFLKIVLYMVLGAQWIWLVDAGQFKQIPLPIGLLLGVIFASHDKFQIDRKLEYAIVLVSALIGFWAHAGVYLIVLK
jgi:hypothetical protein